MASAFTVTKEQAEVIESYAFAADEEQVFLGSQDDDGTLHVAYVPGYRQPDIEVILGGRVPVADNGFAYRSVTPTGEATDTTREH